MKYKNEQTLRFDYNLNSFFANIYQYVATNIVLSGAIAYFVAKSSMIYYILSNPILFFGALVSPLAINIYMSWQAESLTINKAQILYWIYGATTGLSLSSIFLIYRMESIFTSLLISGSIFFIASVYGRITSNNLAQLSSILFIGLLGSMISIFINIFLIKSTFFGQIISIVVICVFTGLIALDSQEILALYYTRESDEAGEKLAIFAALSLYISFVNIFLNILKLLDNKKKN